MSRLIKEEDVVKHAQKVSEICTKHKGLYTDFTDYCGYGERKDGAERT